ncbi:MAG: hypothetical protein WB622_12675 [Acidobacteriaceae bacterium]|jgi:hypothetical protein
MTDPGTTHTHHEEGPHRSEAQQKRPYWMRAHRDWRFWIAVVCIAAALFVYITSVDLSMVPGRRHHATVPVGQ